MPNPKISIIGNTKSRKQRNNGNLLTAFNNNPYSHSLSSVA